MAGPGDEITAAAGGRRGHLRASHADREQVIGTLKAAFVQGMLAKDEFDQRVGQALASRTYAQLAVVTADLPAKPTAAQPPEPARPQCEPPELRPGRVIMVATGLYAGVWPFTFLLPWPTDSEGDPPRGIILLFFSTTLVYASVLLFVLFVVVLSIPAWWREKRSGGQPPRRPAPGADGQASRRPPSAGPGGRLPSVDRGQQHTAMPPRPPAQPAPEMEGRQAPRRHLRLDHPLGRTYSTEPTRYPV
jgi:hypothetical protein